MQLRRNDYSLSDEQEALRDSVRVFLEKRCGSDRVRASEPTGFDADLWNEFQALRPVAMGVPETSGGDGAGLVDLALAAEEVGASAAPIPFVETVVAARALASDPDQSELVERLCGGMIATIAPSAGSLDPRGLRLVPAGAIARVVVARGETGAVLVAGQSPAHVPNLACAPLAWWDLSAGAASATVEFGRVEGEWRLLTAAALVGVGRTALQLGVQYAKDREAFGVPIGSFQAIAHPLADVAIAIDGARRLVMKAGWFADNEPKMLGALATTAFLAASKAAQFASAVAIHTQGGFGFTLESDVQLFYRRAKGWALLGGDRRSLLAEIASEAFGPIESRVDG